MKRFIGLVGMLALFPLAVWAQEPDKCEQKLQETQKELEALQQTVQAVIQPRWLNDMKMIVVLDRAVQAAKEAPRK